MTTEIKITVENLAPENGASLSHFWLAVHDGTFDIFDEGAMASSGIELIAEDGITGLETNIPNFTGTALARFLEDGGNLADLRSIAPVLIDSGIDLSQIQPLVQQFAASGFDARNLLSAVQQLSNPDLDSSEVLTTVETIINSGFDLTTLEPIFEELANSDLDSATILSILGEVANSGLDTTTLLLVVQELTEAGVDPNAFLPAFQELADVGLDLETLQPLFDVFADPNLDLDALASALQGVDLETVLPLIQELLNLGSEVSDLPVISGTIAALFSESEAANNGGIQDLVVGEEESFFSLPSGATSETTIVLDDSNNANRFFSYASMVFPSNDAFIGNDEEEAIPIFDAEGNFIGADFIILGNQVWDAGTEVNDEDSATVASTFDTLFQSVDENGTVQLHPGLLPPGSGGIVDSADAVNADFSAPGYQIARITISEVENNLASFPNGVAAGDTTQTSTVLWTHSNILGEVTFEYATDAEFTQIVGSAVATVSDTSIPVQVEIDDLTPGTQYYYRVTNSLDESEEGRFRTSAATGDHSGLRFGVAPDWQGQLAPFPAISNADERDLDFFVQLGDSIYADIASPDVPNPQAQTLEEFRLKYNEAYSERLDLNTWADLQATTSLLATWDDHEINNDFAGGSRLGIDNNRFLFEGSAPDGTFVNDSPIFEAGLQAFQEYRPLRNEFYGATGDERTANEQKLYRYNNYGSDAATFVLDTRSFRDAPLPFTAENADSELIQQRLEEAFDPNRTLLGEAQLEELKQDLLDAQQEDITWKFVFSSVPIQNFGIPVFGERWEGYASERTELLSFIVDNDIENVVFVTGDFHGNVVNNVTYQEEFGGPQLATGVIDIMTGAVATETLALPFLPPPFNQTFAAPFGTNTIAFTPADILEAQGKSLEEYLALTDRADQDQFVREVVDLRNENLGYVPIGLEAENLGVEGSGIEAQLIQGDYINAHTYGWSEFDIDPVTQQLRVITYGIEPYSQEELEANPNAITSLTPEIINEFVVNPQGDSEIIVFGDSLSDTGNSFAVTGIPPSPPYFEGRVSNGIVAVEILANQLGLNFNPNDNFAFAGATTGRDNTNDDNTGLDLPGLLDQIDEFAARVGAEGADEDALYIIWAGANDFSGLVDGLIPEDPNAFITDSITNLVTAISSLEALGAQEIVVPNLPNLGLIPGSDELEDEATTLTTVFNSALESALDNLDFETTLVDFFSISNAVAQNPADFGFTNISDPLLFQFPTPPNPEEFFFWDTFHPTTQGHAIFAQTIEQTLLGETIQPFFFSSNLDANQEIPPSESLATGTAQLRLNELGTGLNYSLTVSGLDFGVLAGIAPQTPETGDDVTMLHFHNAPRGVNGDVVFGIISPNQDDDDLNIVINADGSTTISGIWEESDSANQPLSEFVSQLRQTQSGEDVDLYFNVHTQDSPMGAIRGQITAGELPAPNPIPNLIVDENNIFSLVNGSEEIALEFTLAGVDAGNVNEISLVRFDDASAAVNGIAPNAPEYLEALASESQVIFSALNSLSQDFLNSRNFPAEDLRRVISSFESGDNFGLFLTPQTTLNAVVENVAESEVLLGFGDITFLDINQLDDGFFQLNWEDETNGDGDFNDLTVTLHTTTDNTLGTGLQRNIEGELIDLRDQAGELLRATIRATGNASFNNVGGLYLVLDEQGTVFDPITGTSLTPEDPGYATVAVNQSIIEFNIIDPNPITIAGGFIYAPYLLANGDEEAFSSPFTLANANGIDHLRLLGDNTFAFEDSLDGGDSSFDDFIFQVDLAVV